MASGSGPHGGGTIRYFGCRRRLYYYPNFLVSLAGMEMRKAVGTFLSIIAIKSIIGFTGDPVLPEADWKLLGTLLLFTMAGLWVGTYLAQKVSQSALKTAFAYIVLLIGL